MAGGPLTKLARTVVPSKFDRKDISYRRRNQQGMLCGGAQSQTKIVNGDLVTTSDQRDEYEEWTHAHLAMAALVLHQCIVSDRVTGVTLTGNV